MRCTVAFSVGYFVNDLILMLKDKEIGGIDMVAHHVLCIGFWGGGLLDNVGTAYHFLFMIEELPTPFLNLRFQVFTPFRACLSVHVCVHGRA